MRSRRFLALPIALLATAALPAAASAATFSNPAAIAINDSTGNCATVVQSPATPYPSQIRVSNQVGSITHATATINGFSHTYPPDVRMLLVGPQGQTTDLFDEASGGTAAVNATITFDDAAAATVPDPLVSGTFKPSQGGGSGCGLGPTNDYPSPAPAGPYGTALAGFDGTNPNGTWSLYVVDDDSGDIGFISGGWSLDLAGVSAGPQPVVPPLPNCDKLKRKLKHQKKTLRRAKAPLKRAGIRSNIAHTKKRLRTLGC